MANGNGGMAHYVRRGLRVGASVFLSAALVAWLSQTVMRRTPVAIAFLVLIFIIVVGIVFDVVGTAITAADETPFHAMAAKRLPGARQALWLVRHADRVTNFLEDIIGDISGAISGAAAATVALQAEHLFASSPAPWIEQLGDILAIAFVAALAVGGKAAGKGVALTQATPIVLKAGKVMGWMEQLSFKRPGTDKRKPPRRRTTP